MVASYRGFVYKYAGQFSLGGNYDSIGSLNAEGGGARIHRIQRVLDLHELPAETEGRLNNIQQALSLCPHSHSHLSTSFLYSC